MKPHQDYMYHAGGIHISCGPVEQIETARKTPTNRPKFFCRLYTVGFLLQLLALPIRRE